MQPRLRQSLLRCSLFSYDFTLQPEVWNSLSVELAKDKKRCNMYSNVITYFCNGGSYFQLLFIVTLMFVA